MKIAYVTLGHTDIASYRYRILAPSKELVALGNKVEVSNKADHSADTVVFSKHWTFNDYSYLLYCKSRGQTTVYDICDDHFHTEKLKEHYLRMSTNADILTVNSEEMARIVYATTGRVPTVIPDPVISPRQAYNPDKPLCLLWYGHSANMPVLYEAYGEPKHPLHLFVPNGAPQPPASWKDCKKITWSAWHSRAVEEGASIASVAFIPYRKDRPAKSANRVLEALWSGLPVITTPLPALDDLDTSAIVYLNGDLDTAVAKIQEKDHTESMSVIQQYIEWKYGPKSVAKQWMEAFQKCA